MSILISCRFKQDDSKKLLVPYFVNFQEALYNGAHVLHAFIVFFLKPHLMCLYDGPTCASVLLNKKQAEGENNGMPCSSLYIQVHAHNSLAFVSGVAEKASVSSASSVTEGLDTYG